MSTTTRPARTETGPTEEKRSLNETAYLLGRCLAAATLLGRDLHGVLEAEGDHLKVVLLEETNLLPKLAELNHLAGRINHAVNALPGSGPRF